VAAGAAEDMLAPQCPADSYRQSLKTFSFLLY